MHVKARNSWSSDELLSVAELIINPATNGGTVADLSTQKLAAMLPDMPAWGVFDGARACLVVGLWPYDEAARRGMLHVAGDGSVKEAWRVVQAFLEAHPDLSIFTLTQDVRLIRLGRRAGLENAGEMDGYTVLVRN